MSKRICAKIGSYTDRDGKEKGRYVDIGVIMQGERGEYVLLDPSVSLAGIYAIQSRQSDKTKDRIMASVFSDEPRQSGGYTDRKPAQQQATMPATSKADDFDDDIPF